MSLINEDQFQGIDCTPIHAAELRMLSFILSNHQRYGLTFEGLWNIAPADLRKDISEFVAKHPPVPNPETRDYPA